MYFDPGSYQGFSTVDAVEIGRRLVLAEGHIFNLYNSNGPREKKKGVAS
jgi:hypothetical protein